MLNLDEMHRCQSSTADKAKLVVVVDTEENFDWSGCHSRDNTSVCAMRAIGRIQDIFDEYGITPVYVIDYPVASQETGYRPLQEIHAGGRCLIGAHLHPWVNPPYEEVVNAHNSYPGNLPRELEAAKLRVLGECIESHFGFHPTIYKAGRYGIGPNTAHILEEQGYEVDLSIRALSDESADGGPDFSRICAWPFWYGTEGHLLELPVTAGFSGLFRKWGVTLQSVAIQPALAPLHVSGVLRRMGLMKRAFLSPETSSLPDLIELVKVLHGDGLRIFSLAFHSPSLEPGNTPYVRSETDLANFLARCRGFFDWFIRDFGGIPVEPLKLKKQLSLSTMSVDSRGTASERVNEARRMS